MRIFILSALLCIGFSSGSLYAQNEENKNDFTVTGTPVITVFANYHAGIGESNHISGFELTRAYLGYQFKLTPSLSGKVIVDAGIAPAEDFLVAQKREVVLKNAMLTWQEKGFTTNGGLIGLLQFGVQEKFWGCRYIAQSFQDLYKMGPSADLGVTAAYKFLPWLEADVSFTNGEGYKNLNMDNKYRYGLGTTLKIRDRFLFRIYGDIYQQSLQEENQQTLALFGGYRTDRFSIGAEYNYQRNNQWVNGNDYYGYSVYTTVPVHKKWKLIARFDHIDSNNKDNLSWSAFTGEMVIAGIEFEPLKQLKITPNYKYFRDFDTKLLTHDTFHTVYLNVLFNW